MHTSAYQPKQIEYPMFQIQIIDTYNVFLVSKFTFPQSRQHNHRFKT